MTENSRWESGLNQAKMPQDTIFCGEIGKIYWHVVCKYKIRDSRFNVLNENKNEENIKMNRINIYLYTL